MSSTAETIKSLQKEIFDKQQTLLKLVKELPLEEVKDYVFQELDGTSTNLSALFGDKDELILIHNMGKACVYCTMWADGFRGYNEMMSDRAAFVLSSPDEPAVLKAFSESRDWHFARVSFHGTSFAEEMGFAEVKEGRTWYQPGFSAFIKKDGKIFRSGKDFFGPGDYYCAPWHMFEFLPEGANGWQPKYTY